MLAWSLSGSILLALTAPAVGGRESSGVKAELSLRIVDVSRRDGDDYRMRAGAASPTAAGYRAVDRAVDRGRRLDRSLATIRAPIRDPQGDCVRTLLRDRLARRGAAIDARLEWRLSGARNDLGLGGGLAHMVDTLLR